MKMLPNVTIFKLDDTHTAACSFIPTKNGFKHQIILIHPIYENEVSKVCYLNRTWETYQFQTALKHAIEKSTTLTTDQKTLYMKKIITNNFS